VRKNKKMKKILMCFVFGIFLVSIFSGFASASINFGVQPQPVYNFGDKANVSILITPNPDFNNVVSVNLKCDSNEVQVYKEFLSVSENAKKEIVVPMIKSLIGNLTGNCDFEVYSGDKLEVYSKSFEVTRNVKIEFLNSGVVVSPSEKVTFEASLTKENGNAFKGNYEAFIDSGNFSSNEFTGQTSNGKISFSFDLPSDFPSGTHKVSLKVFEKDSSGEILNSGEKDSFFEVLQVPKSVEIVLENKSVLPGKSLSGKVVLHDQTGKNIPNYNAYVAIKNLSGEIVQKITTETEKTFKYKVGDYESPGMFKISVLSGDLINSVQFNVLEKKEISSEILNKTLILTNTGNVFYSENVTVKIGDENVVIPLSLGVGKSEEYLISAPDGEYDVVVGDLKKTLSLSGNAIQVERVQRGTSTFPVFIWVFVIIILALGAYFVFKRGYRPKIFVRRKSKSHVKKLSEIPKKTSEAVEINPHRKVELSLSIVGTKQNATVGCVDLKNYSEISSGKGNVKETLSRIYSLVEGKKGFVYKSGSYLFFVLAPALTKTFKNQKEGVFVSQEIKKILDEHNKKFKQKIEFGISLNYGTIITKIESGVIKFMSLGALITSSKKFASHASGEVIVSDKLIENMDEKIKGKLIQIGSLNGYKFEQLVDKESHSTFLKGFVARQERDRLKAQEKFKK